MSASILEGQKQYDRALEVLNAGLNEVPENAELLFKTGVVMDKAGKKEECVARMRKVLELDPDHADALNYIGYTYAEQGINLNEAKSLIEKALAIKPDSGYIVDSLGWVYYQKGKFDDAIRHLERAVSLLPNDPTIAEHLGDAYFMKKQYSKCREMYEKATSLNHPEPEKIKEKIEKVQRLLK
jgi:tetratricopeptide (TPR) repeat protein